MLVVGQRNARYDRNRYRPYGRQALKKLVEHLTHDETGKQVEQSALNAIEDVGLRSMLLGAPYTFVNREVTNSSPRLLTYIAFRSYASPMIFCS
jgi:hypothetical protein